MHYWKHSVFFNQIMQYNGKAYSDYNIGRDLMSIYIEQENQRITWSKASKVPEPPLSNGLDESTLALLGNEMDEGSMPTDRPSRGQKNLGKQSRNDGGGLTCFSALFALPILGLPITLSSKSDSTNNNGG